jgi:hypothetical protein
MAVHVEHHLNKLAKELYHPRENGYSIPLGLPEKYQFFLCQSENVVNRPAF